MMTPNDTLSEDCHLLVNAESLSGLMDLIDIEDLLSPVKVVFTKSGATIWAHDANKTIQAFVDYPLEKYNLKSDPTYMVVEPKRMRDLLNAKFKGSQIRITRKAGEAVTIESKTGGKTVLYPPDLDECLVVPDHWVLPMEKGWIQFPMLDNAPAQTKVTITADELNRGLIDMRVAGASYCVFEFNDSSSQASSGHWQTKETTSRTPIKAKVEGEDASVAFPDLLGAVTSCYPNGDELLIYKHEKTPFFILTNKADTVRILVTEAQNEGAV